MLDLEYGAGSSVPAIITTQQNREVYIYITKKKHTKGVAQDFTSRLNFSPKRSVCAQPAQEKTDQPGKCSLILFLVGSENPMLPPIESERTSFPPDLMTTCSNHHI